MGAFWRGKRRVRRVRAPVEDVLATDEAQRLLDVGAQTGQLDADEVLLALDELDLEPSQLDEFYAALDEAQIAVVHAEEEDVESEPEADAEITTDALQLFLKDIGRVPLLTAAQEVELAKLSSAGITARSRRWWRRTSGSSSRSPSGTGTRVCRSST